MPHPPKPSLGAHDVVPSDLEAFIQSETFPCVGAKSALALGQLSVFEAGSFQSGDSDLDLHRTLTAFGARLRDDASVASMAVLFDAGPAMSERAFETALWDRLQSLNEIDATAGFAWAPGVSDDPADDDFSFSLGGAAYFVVGLHPGASRAARRFGRPALIFNPHGQFERLRLDGRYGSMQEIIRAREIAINGSINPMLKDFAKGREAAQYSGRHVSHTWVCPFQRAMSAPR